MRHAYLQTLIGFGTGSCCPIDCRRVFRGTLGRSQVTVAVSLILFTKSVHVLGARLIIAHTCHELTVDFAPSMSSRQVFGAPPICSHHKQIARLPPLPPLNLIPVAAVQFHELVSLYAHVSSRQICGRPAVSSWQV